ncbi:MAG: hypothetical protein SVS15_08555 [Thermodesulfobacteriota bacterium]|nr:hypothetical protein [Thermodesulfobacteriota bacterium]
MKNFHAFFLWGLSVPGFMGMGKILRLGVVLFLLCVFFLSPCTGKSWAGDGPERKDNTFGTFDEDMRMGRDQETGDIHMRVMPKPKPKPPDQPLPPVIIQPELKYPGSGETETE